MQSLATFLLLLFLSIPNVDEISQINKAERDFNRRYKQIENGKANPKYINKAIKHYKRAEKSPQQLIGLMRSYEFKGSWTNISQEAAKSCYEKAIEIGKAAMKTYPDNAGIHYWYIANYSRWGDLISITQAAKDGVLDEVKATCEKIISLDPNYHQAGALRLLGGIHLEAPNIPFVLTWPSDDEAQDLLSKAYDIAPQHSANAFYYAKMLLEQGQESSAKAVLIKLVNSTARDNYVLVDQKYLQKANDLYNEAF